MRSIRLFCRMVDNSSFFHNLLIANGSSDNSPMMQFDSTSNHFYAQLGDPRSLNCWFSVSRRSKQIKTKNQNRSIDKVQNMGNERRYIYKDPRQDSGQRNISYTRYPKKCFTQTYRDLYGDAMLVLTWMSSNIADGNQQKHLLPSLA